MAEIIIKDGHLYQDGKKLELEFGNQDQIKVIRRYERDIQKFKDGIVEPKISYSVEAAAYFQCVCSNLLEVGDFEAEDMEDISCFEDKTTKCRNCNREYRLIVDKAYKVFNGRRYMDYEKLWVTFK